MSNEPAETVELSAKLMGHELLPWLQPFVRHCGNPVRAPWKLKTRRLLDYLLHAVEDGEGLFRLDGVDYEMRSGDLFWVPPNTDIELIGTSATIHCPYIHFDLIYRPEVSHYHLDIPGGMTDLSAYQELMHPELPDGHPFDAFKGRIRTRANRRIINLMKEVCNEAARSQPYVNLRLNGLMLQIIGDLLLHQRATNPDYQEQIPNIDKAATYIQYHHNEDLRIDDIAAMCDLSPGYFRILFKKHHGCTPRAYIRRCRINKAKELMIQAEYMNLSEIAIAVGFSCIHSFSRAFKDVVGQPPATYRTFGGENVSTEVRRQLKSHEPENYTHARKNLRRKSTKGE